MLNQAICQYVLPDANEALPWQEVSGNKPLWANIAEILSEATGSTYQRMNSPFGKGLLSKGVSQLQEIIDRHAHNLADLRIIQWRDSIVLDLSRLAGCGALKSLSLGYAQKIERASALEQLVTLVKLGVEEPPDEPVDLTRLADLVWLAITDSPHWRNVGQLDGLRMLQWSGFSGADFTVRTLPWQLERLQLDTSTALRSLDGIDRIDRLRYLKLVRLPGIASLDALHGCSQLTHLIVENCRSLANIDAVAQLPNLAYLEIRDCPKLKNVVTFPTNSALTHVFFTGSTRLSTPISALVAPLPRLKFYFAAH